MKPEITIITINYNDVEGLKKTFASVFLQSYADFEYIVIDGGSNDGSRELIAENGSKFQFWISEKDHGVFDAMNKGIQKANGNYLLFLNSGDCFVANDTLTQFMEHPSCKGDVIYGDYKYTEGGKSYPDKISPSFFMRTSLPHQSTLIKKAVFEKIGNYDMTYKIAADRAHFLKAYVSGLFNFSHVPIALALFDTTGISNAEKFRDLKIEEDERLFKENYGVYYPEMLRLISLEKRIKQVEKQTLPGIVNRIKRKIFGS